MQRRNFIKKTGFAGAAISLTPMMGLNMPLEDYNFPLMDLHVHLTSKFTIEKAIDLSIERKVKFGIVEHPAQWALKDDDDLKAYIDKLKKYPVYIGLQPMHTGWASTFSQKLLNKLDYVLMDPQTIPLGNGDYLRIWNFDTKVEDTEEFMERYMAHSMNILKNEPITIFGWPLFLPVCIARDYYTLWTKDRMQEIIIAAKARNIAIEINDMSHTPHEEFILMAKEEGLKFSFGSDDRTGYAGKLPYCKAIAKKCNLTAEDFYIPGNKK